MSAPLRQFGPENTPGVVLPGRTPLAQLLHALNQPLTGLQCSLELALIGPRSPEQYIRVLRDGLELTARMRSLVEAIRELADAEPDGAEELTTVGLDILLRETAEELQPVAEVREIRVVLELDAPLTVQAARRRLCGVVFRFLESALSLAAPASVFRIATSREKNQGRLAVSWEEGPEAPEHSPVSRPELGLLIARVGWNRIGARWEAERKANSQRVTIHLPITAEPKDVKKCSSGEIS